MLGRDRARANETLAEIKKAGGEGEVVLGDVSSVAGAKTLAAAILIATGFLKSFPVDVDDRVAPKKYGSLGQYGRSKQASVMMTVEQAKRFEDEGISAVSMHAGVVIGTRFSGGQPKVFFRSSAGRSRAWRRRLQPRRGATSFFRGRVWRSPQRQLSGQRQAHPVAQASSARPRASEGV